MVLFVQVPSFRVLGVCAQPVDRRANSVSPSSHAAYDASCRCGEQATNSHEFHLHVDKNNTRDSKSPTESIVNRESRIINCEPRILAATQPSSMWRRYATSTDKTTNFDFRRTTQSESYLQIMCESSRSKIESTAQRNSAQHSACLWPATHSRQDVTHLEPKEDTHSRFLPSGASELVSIRSRTGCTNERWSGSAASIRRQVAMRHVNKRSAAWTTLEV